MLVYAKNWNYMQGQQQKHQEQVITHVQSQQQRHPKDVDNIVTLSLLSTVNFTPKTPSLTLSWYLLLDFTHRSCICMSKTNSIQSSCNSRTIITVIKRKSETKFQHKNMLHEKMTKIRFGHKECYPYPIALYTATLSPNTQIGS